MLSTIQMQRAVLPEVALEPHTQSNDGNWPRTPTVLGSGAKLLAVMSVLSSSSSSQNHSNAYATSPSHMSYACDSFHILEQFHKEYTWQTSLDSPRIRVDISWKFFDQYNSQQARSLSFSTPGPDMYHRHFGVRSTCSPKTAVDIPHRRSGRNLGTGDRSGGRVSSTGGELYLGLTSCEPPLGAHFLKSTRNIIP
ncbi:hypothetical protein Tco_0593254 [Tanacetum coccineum]